MTDHKQRDAAHDEPHSKEVRIYYVLPGRDGEERHISADARTLRELIGGYFKNAGVAWRGADGLAILADDDAWNKGMLVNLQFGDVTIYGPAIFCRYSSDACLVDLTDADIAMFGEHVQRDFPIKD